jgi:hypothetical protein
VFAAGGDRFFYGPNSLTWFRIERGADGAHVMEMHQNGNDEAERATRTGDVPPDVQVSRAILDSYVGHYLTEGPQADIAMGESGVLTIQLTGQSPLPLRPINDTEFTVQGVNARVVFHPESGAVNRFTVHQGGREIEARRAPR